MSPAFLLAVLAAGLLAMIPVWRLRQAGWPASWLAGAWVALAACLVLVLRFPPTGRLLVPILVLAFLAPFVASPERVTRLLRREPRGVVIDVTPRLGNRGPQEHGDTTERAGDETDGDDDDPSRAS